MILQTFNYILKMLLPVYAKKLWKIIFENFNRLFAIHVIRLSAGYKSSELKDLAIRIRADQQLIEDIFEKNIKEADIKEGVAVYKGLSELFRCDVEKVAQTSQVIVQKIKEVFDDETIVVFYDSTRRLLLK